MPQEKFISLSQSWLRCAEKYTDTYKLGNRSGVMAEALKALRKQELIRGHRQMAKDHTDNPDPLL
jgi:hypothetical protein